MNVLVIGGAGKVGSIIRAAIEREHHCRYLDLKPVPGAEERSTIGNVNDDAAIIDALRGVDAVMYLAMGQATADLRTVDDINAAFDVNLRGWYRALFHGLKLGVRRWVYASSLSVYQKRFGTEYVDEATPPNAWRPYGFSKRLAEQVCAAGAQQYPDATIVALRLILPQTDEEYLALSQQPSTGITSLVQGPQDLRRLFLAALACDRPGCHIVQTSGDLAGRLLPNTHATQLLGWRPEQSVAPAAQARANTD